MKKPDRAEHIFGLCAKYHITYKVSRIGSRARGTTIYLNGDDFRRVSDRWYAAALHEIGHVVLKHTRISMPGPHAMAANRKAWVPRRLKIERDAWRWAKAHALYWTAPMERCCVKSMKSHAQHY